MTVNEGDILSNDFNFLQVTASFTVFSYFSAEFFHGCRVGKKVGVIVNLVLYSFCLRFQPSLVHFSQQATCRVEKEEQRGCTNIGVFLDVGKAR